MFIVYFVDEPHWRTEQIETGLRVIIIYRWLSVSLSASYHDQLDFCLPYYCSSGNCLILSWIQHDNKGKILLIHDKNLLNTRCESFSLQYFWCWLAQVCDTGVSQYSVSLSLSLAVAPWPRCVNHTLDTSLWWGELIELICEGGEEGDE